MYPSYRLHATQLQAILCVFCSLGPLVSLFALFFARPSFVFKGLQPLFQKHPGYGYPSRFYGAPEVWVPHRPFCETRGPLEAYDASP